MNPTTSATHPTTSDISMFMQELGYKWSNEAQIYYETGNYEAHITRKGAVKLYKKFLGANPYQPVLPQQPPKEDYQSNK